MSDVATSREVDTLSVMAKNKKPTGGKHKTPRRNVGVPEDWHAILRRCSAARKSTVVFTLIDLIAKEAEAQSITQLPPFPWEDGDEDGADD